jgi:hypothetical protein
MESDLFCTILAGKNTGGSFFGRIWHDFRESITSFLLNSGREKYWGVIFQSVLACFGKSIMSSHLVGLLGKKKHPLPLNKFSRPPD